MTDAGKIKDKKQRFYDLLVQIPHGKVTTYGRLAKIIHTSPRVIGYWCATNSHFPRVPCHRVVSSDGSIGGYTHPAGIKKKIELLEKEGIATKKGKIVGFQSNFFKIKK